MSCVKPRARSDSTLRRAWPAVLAAMLLGASLLAAAQALYRWTDKDGRVSYGDRPPPGALNVTRMEADIPPTPAPPASPRQAPPREPAAPREVAPAGSGAQSGNADILTQRRASRARLEEDLAQARERLAAARKALAEANDPREEERQVVQQRVDGSNAAATSRQNCRQVAGTDGRKSTFCPALIPNEKYYERMAGLEEAVRRAEEAVAAAENAYRRGTD
jgi:hypothetical protein